MNLSDKVRMLFWIMSLVKRRGPVSLREINDEWEKNELSEKRSFDRNTFKSHLNNIEEIFGIKISYLHGGYCIADDEMTKMSSLHDLLISHIQNIEFYSKFNNLGDKLQVEDIAEGSQYLDFIGQALKKNLLLCMEYQKFADEKSKILTVEPYCIKSKDRRWYMLAKCTSTKQMRTYALDRICSLTITGQHFNPDQSVDICNYYSNCIGVYADDQKLENIELKTTAWQAKYLRTLPLHKSQQETSPCVFRYYVDVTPDFINEILKMGNNVEVIKPDSLRCAIGNIVNEMGKIYRVKNK